MMTETGNPPQEDINALREQLNEAHAELEQLRSEAANATATSAQLRENLARAGEAETASAAEAQEAREYAAAAEARLRTAAEKYRDLVVRTEPELPEELITGDDIDEIDASVGSARRIVEDVRSRLQTQPPPRIPAGAPARTAPDFSTLPPEEKIRIGLSQRAS
jgi:chromosome segregation ATPase